MNTPNNIQLYLEDIRDIAEILGDKTIIKVGRVKYKNIEEFEKKYYGKKIDNIRLEASASEYPEYVELTSSGSVYINIEDKFKELEMANYLFSKQPTIDQYIDNILRIIYRAGLIFSCSTLLSTTIFKYSEMVEKHIVIMGVSVFLLSFIISLFQSFQLLIPASYNRNIIICKTSDDKASFWQNKKFWAILLILLTAFINWLFSLI